MGDLQLNNTRKYFYFQTRIHSGSAALVKDDELWTQALGAISEITDECGIEIYGLVMKKRSFYLAFSTPYFNENILILDWEMRIRKQLGIRFDRPVSCEPLTDEGDLKNRLLEIYGDQLSLKNNSIQWRNPFNSLKLLLEGSAQARLFKDPLKIVFQPSLLLHIGKRTQSEISVENQQEI